MTTRDLFLSNDTIRQKLSLVNELRSGILSDPFNRRKYVRHIDLSEIVLRAAEIDQSRRIVVGVGGFPASGKTTASISLVNHINSFVDDDLAVHLPMDGFHFSNTRLEADGLIGIKGDLATYDVIAYARKLEKFKRCPGRASHAPDYVRARHEVVQNKIYLAASARILVTEGIYVGYSVGRWGQVSRLIDLLIYLDVEPELCIDRIISRNLAVGRDNSEIELKVCNDLGFMEKSVGIASLANYIIASPI